MVRPPRATFQMADVFLSGELRGGMTMPIK